MGQRDRRGTTWDTPASGTNFGIAGGDNGPMSSTDDDDQRAEVKRLRRTGETIRAIAERLGLSKSRVGRIAAELEDDEVGVEYADDHADDSDLDADEVARLIAMDSGQPVTPPITYVGVGTVVSEVKGWDSPQVSRELRYLDAEGRSLSVLDLYRFTQQLESEGRWTEAEELVADLDRQHAEDPELELTYDMLGTNPSYQPRAQASEGVGARWTFGPPA